MQDYLNIGLIALWPLLCCIFFLKFDTLTATFIAIVGGMLLLPVGVEIDFPLIPAIDKYVASYIGSIVGIVLIKKNTFYWLGQKGTVRWIIVAIVSISFINFIFNTNPLYNGVWKAGLTIHEAISSSIATYLALLPLIIGINIVKSEADLIKIYKLLVVALLLYLPFVLFEIRFSPQLHKLIYGFSPHEFKQQIRDDGFRAVVFLGHGLLTANIYLCGFFSLITLTKMKQYFISKIINYQLIFVFFVSLILLKSATAIVLALVGLVVFYTNFSTVRNFLLRAIVVFACIYPLVVYTSILPLDWLYANLQGIFAIERLDSLYFRFYNESLLLEYLGDYFLIGYGGSGRAILAGLIPDGTWVVWTLRYGFIFWVLNVVLYSVYVFQKADSCYKRNAMQIFSVMPMIILLDQIPNSSWSMPFIWLVSGGLISLSTYYNKAQT